MMFGGLAIMVAVIILVPLFNLQPPPDTSLPKRSRGRPRKNVSPKYLEVNTKWDI